MKNILFAIISTLVFFSCKKNNSVPKDEKDPKTNNPSALAHWIPNWANDTLIAIYQDEGDDRMKFDTIFSYSRGDTSLIKYKGTEYYLWTEVTEELNKLNPEWFEENASDYAFCYIGKTPLDSKSAFTGNALTGANPAKYYDQNFKNWKTQEQAILINSRKPPFPDSRFAGYNGFYTTAYKQ